MCVRDRVCVCACVRVCVRACVYVYKRYISVPGYMYAYYKC